MYIMYYMTMLQYFLLHNIHFVLTVYTVFLGISHADFFSNLFISIVQQLI